ncbi:isochorismatase family protein [Aquabacterium sp.]|uniref:isochorismatase family protein n=1 Tax=Aquabacterium sp. TaxID=1872578 RepID=UPI004037899D
MTIPKIASYAMPEPELWPSSRVKWVPDPARAVLLIHDMQDYFVNFFDRDKAPVPELLHRIATLREACRQVGVPVVYTAQPHEQSAAARALLQDWWGPGITAQPDQANVVEVLHPAQHEQVLTKWRYSAFAKSDLQAQMKAQGRDQLMVCGMYAHIGVMTTCVDAFMRDIQPFLVADAVADFSREDHLMALNWVAGRCGVVMGAAAVCSVMQSRAKMAAYDGPQALLNEVALMLEIPSSDLRPQDNLLDMGLDSIRLMSLINRWRQAGLQCEFLALAEQPSIQAWWALLYPEAPGKAV